MLLFSDTITIPCNGITDNKKFSRIRRLSYDKPEYVRNFDRVTHISWLLLDLLILILPFFGHTFKACFFFGKKVPSEESIFISAGPFLPEESAKHHILKLA